MTIGVGASTRKLTETPKAVAANSTQVLAGSRMAFIDNIRVVLTIMVVVFHLAITYGGEGSWFYRERPTTELAGLLLTLFIILSQFFFMGLFFLISGYFVPGSLSRKGNLRYFKDRLVRLGIPLLGYFFLISPFVEYIKSVSIGDYAGTLGQKYLWFWQNLKLYPGPLWFVELLLVFSLAYIFGKAIIDWVKRSPTNSLQNSSPKLITHGKIITFILALAPLNFIIRLIVPIGVEWAHILVAFLPQYIFMFAVGILAYQNGWLPDLSKGVRRVWSVIAIIAMVSLPIIMFLGGATEPFMGGLTWQSAVLSTWEAIFCVSMAILMLGLFRLRFDGQGSLMRFLSRNAYAVYIIHPALIVPLTYSLRGIHIDPLLKFLLVAPPAVALCFLISHFIVRRIPLADKLL